jgi:hypothetical protein
VPIAEVQDASSAVLEAAKTGDEVALLAIFGPDTKEILFSGDTVQDSFSDPARREISGEWQFDTDRRLGISAVALGQISFTASARAGYAVLANRPRLSVPSGNGPVDECGSPTVRRMSQLTRQ